jgi:hypothetical protein
VIDCERQTLVLRVTHRKLLPVCTWILLIVLRLFNYRLLYLVQTPSIRPLILAFHPAVIWLDTYDLLISSLCELTKISFYLSMLLWSGKELHLALWWAHLLLCFRPLRTVNVVVLIDRYLKVFNTRYHSIVIVAKLWRWLPWSLKLHKILLVTLIFHLSELGHKLGAFAISLMIIQLCHMLLILTFFQIAEANTWVEPSILLRLRVLNLIWKHGTFWGLNLLS